MDIAYYEFIILTNQEDFLHEVGQLRKKLSSELNFKIADLLDIKAIDSWIIEKEKFYINKKHKSLIGYLKQKSREITKKYQPHNATKNSFVDSVFWFILTNKVIFYKEKRLTVTSKINSVTGEKEVLIKVYKWTTKEDLINSWEKIIKPAIGKLPSNYELPSKNKTEYFQSQLKIFKCYLRAKYCWGKSTHLFSHLYKSEEIADIFEKLPSKKIPDIDTFQKMIKRFSENYGRLTVISDSELKVPIK